MEQSAAERILASTEAPKPEGESDPEEIYDVAAEAFLSAINSKDPKAIAAAMRGFVAVCNAREE